MEDYASQHGISGVVAVRGAAQTAVTAGAGGDDTYVYGPVIDRLASGGPFDAALGVVSVEAVIGGGKKADIYSVFQHDDDPAGGTMADYTPPNQDAAAKTAALADGATEKGTLQHSVDLTGAKRYIRHGAKVNMSAADTDTAKYSSLVVLGGAKKKPVEPAGVFVA